jgi:hypothetical protein
MKAPLCVLLTVLLTYPVASSAQLPAYNPPDDAAFAFLGATPKKVDNPGTLTKLGVALANGIDGSGRAQGGLAVSFLPTTILGWSPTPERYRSGSIPFALYNTQLSVASLKATGDTSSTNMALGLRVVVAGPDPFADGRFREIYTGVLNTCLANSFGVDTALMSIQPRAGARAFETRDPADPKTILKPDPGSLIVAETLAVISRLGQPGAVPETLVVHRVRGGKDASQDTVRSWVVKSASPNSANAISCATTKKAVLLKSWNADHWNDPALSFAAGGGERFVGSSFSKATWAGWSGWMVGAVPLRTYGQIAGQFRYQQQPTLSSGPSHDVWSLGSRVTMGKETWNGFVEYSRVLKYTNGVLDGNAKNSWSYGLEFMASESIWLSAGLGDSYDAATKANKSVTFLNLKWGYGNERTLGR